MYCARCYREFAPGEKVDHAILPGAEAPVPVCRDQYLCYEGANLRPDQKRPKMRRVISIAKKYVKAG